MVIDDMITMAEDVPDWYCDICRDKAFVAFKGSFECYECGNQVALCKKHFQEFAEKIRSIGGVK